LHRTGEAAEFFAQLAENERGGEVEQRDRDGQRAPLPSARAHEVDRQRDRGEHQHAGVHQSPGAIIPFALVVVVPGEKQDERDGRFSHGKRAKSLHRSRAQHLQERRQKRHAGEQRQRHGLGPAERSANRH
jgi:hypothetical protein